MITRLLCVTVLITFVVRHAHCESLSLVVRGNTRDCLYYERSKSERIEVDIQIRKGERIDFQLFDPDNRLIQQKDSITEHAIDRLAHLQGAYAFCFSNQHTFTRDAVIELDYDFNQEVEKESKLMKKIKEEKNQFIMEILRRRPMDHLKGEEEGEDVPSNDRVEEIEHKLTIISIQLDRIGASMSRYKSKMAYHFHLANSNLSYVTYASIGISVAIILTGMIQVIVLKSLFNGHLNFKIWQF